MENPTTEDTTVPTTGTPISEVPSAEGGEGNVSPSIGSGSSDFAPQSVGENSTSTLKTSASAAEQLGSMSDSAPTASASMADEAGNAGAPAADASSAAGAAAQSEVAPADEHPHTSILRRLTGLLRRDWNLFTGELEALLKEAESHL